jgi:hypothetical protein
MKVVSKRSLYLVEEIELSQNLACGVAMPILPAAILW